MSPKCPAKSPEDVIELPSESSSKISVVTSPQLMISQKKVKVDKAVEHVFAQMPLKAPTPPKPMKNEEKKESQQKKVTMDTSVKKQQESIRIGAYQQQ